MRHKVLAKRAGISVIKRNGKYYLLEPTLGQMKLEKKAAEEIARELKEGKK